MLYKTKDEKLIIKTEEIISMVKDEIEIFNQKQNRNEEKFIIGFTTKSPVQTIYLAPSKEVRDEEFRKIVEVMK